MLIMNNNQKQNKENTNQIWSDESYKEHSYILQKREKKFILIMM